MHEICYIPCFLYRLAPLLYGAHAYDDLEMHSQDFVLETKRIIIPEYPHAFNPSIIRWKDRLLMSFRVIPDAKQPFTSWLGLVWLDDALRPVGKVKKLSLRSKESTVPSRAEDGRLIAVGKKLYFVYSDNEDELITRGGFRVYVAQLQWNGKGFAIKHIERLCSFEGNDESKREKNWVPFDDNGTLLLSYSLSPHYVLKPLLGNTEHCATHAFSEGEIDWQWGELRGGTPGIKDGDHYLAFFHSSKQMITAHSQPKEMPHYFMGAYTFSSTYPFELTSMSKEPIIGKNFYHGETYKPWWGSVRVVFPGGFVADKNYIWIAYGRQDHELWVAKLDKNKLYASLVPVS